MSHPLNPQALCRLYLDAVLPCFADLAAQDKEAQQAIAGWDCVIGFRVLGGPAASLEITGGRILYRKGCPKAATVSLVFLGDGHLNAFFSGKKWALPVVAWGLWHIGILIGFSALAERLQHILEGAPEILASDEGRRLFTRLTLITAGLGLKPLAEYDAPARELLAHLPPGLASFTIEGEPEATVWFDNRPALPNKTDAGWGVPPRRPDVAIRFADREIAYGALRDEIDTMAAVGLRQIVVDGLVPLADGLNLVMERLRAYLEP